MPNACIACGFHVTHEIYHNSDQPLSVLHLPRSHEEARDALKFPMNFRACANCGHIFNVDFDYYKVPYEDNSNLMYNNAHAWKQYMQELADELVETHNAKGKTLVDIGCGDGGFLALLLGEELGNRCIGFEPGVEAHNARKRGLEVYKDYFAPQRDLKRLRPDFLICRHVIEHLAEPLQFVSDIAFWCNTYEVFPIFVAEVPRIDEAVRQRRVNDYLYEHPSNFTQFSFRNMFEVAGYEALDVRPVYGDEVVVAIVRPKAQPRLAEIRRTAEEYRDALKDQDGRVRAELDALRDQGKTIAFWGATGKGAAFLNAFDLFDNSYPVVVDSDYNKVGRFVPRTAQEIRPPEHLLEHPADVIVITTQWRARDILHEIRSRGIPHEQVLVLVDQHLRPLRGAGAASAAGASPAGPKAGTRDPAWRFATSREFAGGEARTSAAPKAHNPEQV